MQSTPASLLERLRRPHETLAWDSFVELYSPLLFHWAKRLGLQESDAADLVQDVFLLLWRRLPSFEYDASRSFHAWLKTLFMNRARQRLRTLTPAGMQPLADVADDATDGTEEREYREYLLHRALQLVEREFSPEHLNAFRAYVLQGQSVEQVAAQHRLSVGTVYCIKSRILNRLRRELAHLVDS